MPSTVCEAFFPAQLKCLADTPRPGSHQCGPRQRRSCPESLRLGAAGSRGLVIGKQATPRQCSVHYEIWCSQLQGVYAFLVKHGVGGGILEQVFDNPHLLLTEPVLVS
jgi:hypothetical protein